MAAAGAALPEPLSDENLIERLRAGDRASFEILYERYFPRVFSFVSKRMGSRADAEETVQEVFVNVFSSIGGFRGEAPFAAWLFGLTRRTLAGRYKKRRHDTVPLPESDAETPSLPGTLSRVASMVVRRSRGEVGVVSRPRRSLQ